MVFDLCEQPPVASGVGHVKLLFCQLHFECFCCERWRAYSVLKKLSDYVLVVHRPDWLRLIGYYAGGN